MKQTLLIVFSTVWFFASFCSAQYSNKTPYYPNGLSEAFSLDDYILTPPYIQTPLADTSNCLSDQCNNNPSAFIVVYESDPFNVTICICDDAVMDFTTMAQKFGRVPYKVRSTPVVSITSASVGKGSGAFTIDNKIAFFDQTEATEVFVHESAHVFDHGTLSSTAEWLNDINEDTCVPDPYSQTNAVEDFAQVLVTWTYYVVSNNITNAPSCMFNQLQYLSSLLSASDILSHLYHPNGSETVCSLSISQSLSNSWVSNNQVSSLYAVTFTNIGTSNFQVLFELGSDVTSFWIVQAQSNGLFALPSWLASGLPPASSLQWGYIISSSSPATINVVQPSSCSNNQSSTCNAQVSLSIEQTWTGGGLGAISILNTGTQDLLSVSFSIGAANLDTWNTQTLASGLFTPSSYSLPILVGAELNNIGFTFSGEVFPTASLVSVSC